MPTRLNPVIVVPGITGTSLRDEYQVTPEPVWSAVLNKAYDRIALHPDDTRYELLQPSRVRVDAAFELIYAELVNELRHNPSAKSDEPVPVFAFPYDWRQPLEATERLLEVFIGEVLERTRLLRHYFNSDWFDEPLVNLVGHSMGGMIITGYLERLGNKAPVGKVATIATPFRGSCEAVIKILTGTAVLGPLSPASREREAARLTPTLYQLAPSYSDALFDVDTQADLSAFDVEAWQAGVTETLAEFIRMNGVDPGASKAAREKEATTLLGTMLEQASDFTDRLEGFTLKSAKLLPTDWLAIVGVDSPTRIRLPVKQTPDGVRYQLESDGIKNDWLPNSPSTDTGDGTVPFFGAECSFLERANLVCLSPQDLGPFEFADHVLTRLGGWHATLPNVNLVHRLITAHFRGDAADEEIGGRIPPGVPADEWSPPIKGLRAK